MFYVYEWYEVKTGNVFYVGKGTGRRYKVRQHNQFFNNFVKQNDCESRIIKEFEEEKEAFAYEHERITELKAAGQCVCNIYNGGAGGSVNWWSDELREQYSKKNVMKSKRQRDRMRSNNPMKNAETANRVGKKHRRAVVINGEKYEMASDAASKYGVAEVTIRTWCKKGRTTNNELCGYADGGFVRSQKIQNRGGCRKSSLSKPVFVDGQYFESMADAARFIGDTVQNIKSAILRNGKCKGHICKYANQQPS